MKKILLVVFFLLFSLVFIHVNIDVNKQLAIKVKENRFEPIEETNFSSTEVATVPKTLFSLGHAFSIKTILMDYNATPKYVEVYEQNDLYHIFLLIQDDRNVSGTLYRVFNFTYLTAKIVDESIDIISVRMYNLTATIEEGLNPDIKSIKSILFNNTLYVFYSYMNGTGEDAIANVEYIEFGSVINRTIIENVTEREILAVQAYTDGSRLFVIWSETYYIRSILNLRSNQYAEIYAYEVTSGTYSATSEQISGPKISVYPSRVRFSDVIDDGSTLKLMATIVWTAGESELVLIKVDKNVLDISSVPIYRTSDISDIIGLPYDFGKICFTKFDFNGELHYFVAFELYTDEDRRLALILFDSDFDPVWPNEIIAPDELSLARLPHLIDTNILNVIDLFAVKLTINQKIIRYRIRVTTENVFFDNMETLSSELTKNTILYTINGNFSSNLTLGVIRYSTPADVGVYFSVGLKDSDGDYLGDSLESIYNTDPFNNDSDADGLNDGTEVYIYGTNPANNDTDDDLLSDYNEIMIYSTNPFKPDTDGDGLIDGEEVKYGADPHKEDTDGDGLSDYQEVIVGVNYWVGNQTNTSLAFSSPTEQDTDGDGLSDLVEYTEKLNPNSTDTDGDGLSDFNELKLYLTNPHKKDTDGDGLDDHLEIEMHLDPNNPDTDGDGLKDGDEVLVYHLDPNNPDTDGDGLKDGDEVLGRFGYKTNPKSRDTDGDGLSDSQEILQMKTNPLLADTDCDFLPDYADPFPTTNNFLFVIPLFIGISITYAYSYGAFRSWRRDILVIGLSDEGGTPMFIVPEDKLKREPIMVSSALVGICGLISEISGKEQKFMILGGKPAILLSKGNYSVLFVFARSNYKKLEKNIRRLHEFIEKKYESVLTSWSGAEEEVLPIKNLVEEIIYGKTIKEIEEVEVELEEIEGEEIEVEPEEFKLE